MPRGTLDRYYDADAHMIAPTPKQLFGEFVYEGELKVQVNQEPLPDQQRDERIHNVVFAWQDSLNEEIETNNALLAAFKKKFSEGYGPSGWEICEYADVLATAKIENCHSNG